MHKNRVVLLYNNNEITIIFVSQLIQYLKEELKPNPVKIDKIQRPNRKTDQSPNRETVQSPKDP